MLRIISASIFLSSCSFALAEVIDPTPWLNKSLNSAAECSTIKTGFDARFSASFDKEEKRHVIDFTCKKHADCSFDWCGGEKKFVIAKNTELKKVEDAGAQQPRAGLKTETLNTEIKSEATAPIKAIVAETKNIEPIEKKSEPKIAIIDFKRSNFSLTVESSLKDKIAQRNKNLNIETKKFPKAINESWMTFALANTQVQNVALSTEEQTIQKIEPKNTTQRIIAPGLTEAGMHMQRSAEKMQKLAEYQERNRAK